MSSKKISLLFPEKLELRKRLRKNLPLNLKPPYHLYVSNSLGDFIHNETETFDDLVLSLSNFYFERARAKMYSRLLSGTRLISALVVLYEPVEQAQIYLCTPKGRVRIEDYL